MCWLMNTADRMVRLYLPDIFAFHLRSLDLPLVSQDSKQRIGQDDRESQVPNQSDGIEEVGVARSSIYPQVIEGRA